MYSHLRMCREAEHTDQVQTEKNKQNTENLKSIQKLV